MGLTIFAVALGRRRLSLAYVVLRTVRVRKLPSWKPPEGGRLQCGVAPRGIGLPHSETGHNGHGARQHRGGGAAHGAFNPGIFVTPNSSAVVRKKMRHRAIPVIRPSSAYHRESDLLERELPPFGLAQPIHSFIGISASADVSATLVPLPRQWKHGEQRLLCPGG